MLDVRPHGVPALPAGYFEPEVPGCAAAPPRPRAWPPRRRSRAARVLALVAAALMAAAAFHADGRYDVEPFSPGSSEPAVYFVDRWSSRVWLCEPPGRGDSSPVCRRVLGPPPVGR